ncbi:hydroxymethylglutaryl-CoA lyase [Arachidicoccus sp.]|uniref:hydroxymethylglutaryl-CoA lyase n=1 Tax=Arachidicoccus sp. TaxID=1872624 RepID=UPI003D260074
MINDLQLVECPRDAMQGWPHIIATEKKVNYLNTLLRVGFHTIDFGSFVSPKAIPQMADTKNVLPHLDLSSTKSKLLAIVANVRGAEDACSFEQINVLGFPFSISPTFQMRNTNSTMEESLQRVEAIQELCIVNKKELVIYLSMGFGNPYGDAYNEEILLHWASEMVKRGIKIISLSDTVGLATTKDISFALETLIPKYPGVTFGVHLHSTRENIRQKVKAALSAGCKRFDGALKGIGGCPMAQNDLVGNMDTEKMIDCFEEDKYSLALDKAALQKAHLLADDIFI